MQEGKHNQSYIMKNSVFLKITSKLLKEPSRSRRSHMGGRIMQAADQEPEHWKG